MKQRAARTLALAASLMLVLAAVRVDRAGANIVPQASNEPRQQLKGSAPPLPVLPREFTGESLDKFVLGLMDEVDRLKMLGIRKTQRFGRSDPRMAPSSSLEDGDEGDGDDRSMLG